MTNTTPWRITIDTNPDQCNLKCIMCDTHSIYNTTSPRRSRMAPELLERILKEAVAAGVEEVIPSTMGEPLMYPYFNKFIEILTPSNTKLNLTTNGTFPKKGVEKWARELLPITSDTKISMNGTSSDTNEKVMIKADTTKMLANIKTYLQVRDEITSKTHRPTVTLQVTFMKNNLVGVREVVEFAIEHNIDRVKGHHLWVTHSELKKEDLRAPKNDGIWNEFVEKIKPLRGKVKLENFEKLSSSTQVLAHYKCPFLNKELWVDSSGKYNVCCAPSKRRVELGNFGNIDEIKIVNLFKSEKYRNLVNNYKDKPLCQQCLLRRPPNE